MFTILDICSHTGYRKRRGTRDQIANIRWIIKKERFPEKHLLLLYWLCQSLCVDHNKLWKILKEMRILDHLTCLLRNLYAGQEAIYMEFRKMVTITLCTRQQNRHWCIEQSYGLCGRGRGWENLGEWHWNMYNIMYETSCQSRFDAWYWMLGAGALGRPRGMENTCIPVADSFWHLAKLIQLCKV